MIRQYNWIKKGPYIKTPDDVGILLSTDQTFTIGTDWGVDPGFRTSGGILQLKRSAASPWENYDTGSGHTIKDEGVALPARGGLNFIGSGVTATDNAGSDSTDVTFTGTGSGDVVGPASAVDSNFASFNTTTGKLIKDSGVSASSFATASQGAKADTAVQPGDLATVATTGAYNDLSGKPDLSVYDNFEQYANLAAFPATGSSEIIYLAIDTGLIYRWTGSAYGIMSAELALGETSATAYRGDRGKIAYDHTSLTNNPHNVTKAQVGLSNVPNTDFTSAVAANTAKVTNATHTGDVTGDTVLTIANGAVTPAKMQGTAPTSAKYYRGDGTWNTPTNTTYIESTTGTAITATTQTAAVNNLYYANNATSVAFTLPATAAINSVVEILGLHATGTFTVIAPAGDNISINGNDTGAAGVLTGTARSTVKLRCIVANTTWEVVTYTGSLSTNTGYVTSTPSAVETLSNKTLTTPAIASIKGTLTTDTDGATITFDKNVSDFHNVVLGGNRTLALSNMAVGDRIVLRLTQDGTGSRTVTWFSTIKWADGGTAPTLTTTIGKADMFGFLCTGSGTYDGFVIGLNL